MDRNQGTAHADLLRQLGEQVESLTQSESWLAWLEVAAKFHSYSFGNQMLIMAQRPDASRVGGYRTWQQLGRQVRQGEKGIKILAPMIVKRRDAKDDADDTLLLFKVVHVFAFEQTDGEPLPEVEWPILATMPDESLYNHLEEVCDALGISLARTSQSANGARGWYDPTARQVTLVDTYPLASQTRTLLHELAHSLDPGCHGDRDQTPRAERELIAESAAYVVGKRLGLAMDACSTHYLASWGGQPKELERIAVKILSVAADLESAVRAGVEQLVAV